MRHARPLLLALCACAAVGCTYFGPPVPVYGEGDEVAALAGVWEGAYESDGDGRRGTLSFRLAADADSAYGEVVMLAEPAGRTVASPGPDSLGEGRAVPLAPRAERPRIRFVRVERGMVAGTLDPYTDPACGCAIQTTFQGALSGDEIRGTFVSWRVNGGTLRRGTWHAERRPGG
jgi:hypothetical protein